MESRNLSCFATKKRAVISERDKEGRKSGKSDRGKKFDQPKKFRRLRQFSPSDHKTAVTSDIPGEEDKKNPIPPLSPCYVGEAQKCSLSQMTCGHGMEVPGSALFNQHLHMSDNAMASIYSRDRI